MKILFLSKRHPQGRDLLNRPYGRFYFLPKQLAESGHEVHVALLSHKRLPSKEVKHSGITWSSDDLFPSGPNRYLRRLHDLMKTTHPDWVVGLSDTYYGILAARLGKKYNVKVAIDAYDNYEAYIPWAKPLHWAWRRAVRQADLVTVTGPQLQTLLGKTRASTPPLITPMAADPIFTPGDRRAARERLGLPQDCLIAAYCGAMAPGRDMESLFAAMEQLPDIYFVASGRVAMTLPLRLQHLGYLADERVPDVFTAADVTIITAEPSTFGYYACPVKLYEALACGVPVVCANLPTLRWIAGENADYYDTGDAQSLAAAIQRQLKHPKLPAQTNGWEVSGKIYAQALSQCSSDDSAGLSRH